MKKRTRILLLGAVLAISTPAFCDECANLALSFSQYPDSMSRVQLQELKNCVDAKLRNSLGLPEVKSPTVRVQPMPGLPTSKIPPFPAPDSPSPKPAPPVIISPHNQ
jgi:hypothetical protein